MLLQRRSVALSCSTLPTLPEEQTVLASACKQPHVLLICCAALGEPRPRVGDSGGLTGQAALHRDECDCFGSSNLERFVTLTPEMAWTASVGAASPRKGAGLRSGPGVGWQKPSAAPTAALPRKKTAVLSQRAPRRDSTSAGKPSVTYFCKKRAVLRPLPWRGLVLLLLSTSRAAVLCLP